MNYMFSSDNIKTVCIQRIEQDSFDSFAIYNEFIRWIDKKYLNDLKEIKENHLELLYIPMEEVGCIIKEFSDDVRSVESIIKLKKIDNNNNKSNFEEFICDIKEEYEFLSFSIRDEEKEYKYYNRIVSWYTLLNEYIKGVLYNMSNSRLDLSNFNFDISYELKIYPVEVLKVLR